MNQNYQLYQSRTTKLNMARPIQLRSPQKTTNIFTVKTISELPDYNKTLYSIVGDHKFKQKMLTGFSNSKKNSGWQNSNSNNKTLQQTFDKTCVSNTIKQTYPKHHTICKYSSSLETGLLTNRLSLAKQIDITREARIMNQFRVYKSRDRKIEKHLNRTLHQKTSTPVTLDTITFNSIKQIYVHPNPEKLQLVNDNVPEYWKNSLRDNQKRLKRHLKGNTYKPSIAQQMLQTLRGRNLIEKSMPKIKQQFIDPSCSRRNTINHPIRRAGFSLKGNSLSKISVEDTCIPKIDTHNCNNTFTSDFDEVHTVKYDAKNRWRASQMP